MFWNEPNLYGATFFKEGLGVNPLHVPIAANPWQTLGRFPGFGQVPPMFNAPSAFMPQVPQFPYTPFTMPQAQVNPFITPFPQMNAPYYPQFPYPQVPQMNAPYYPQFPYTQVPQMIAPYYPQFPYTQVPQMNAPYYPQLPPWNMPFAEQYRNLPQFTGYRPFGGSC